MNHLCGYNAHPLGDVPLAHQVGGTEATFPLAYPVGQSRRIVTGKEGVEPPRAFTSPVFKTSAVAHRLAFPTIFMAEGTGIEPAVGISPDTFSKRAPYHSATLPRGAI